MVHPVTASQIPEEQRIFTDAWKLLKSYRNLPHNGKDEDWVELLDLANQIYESGGKNPATATLSKYLALGVVYYLETLEQEGQGGGR